MKGNESLNAQSAALAGSIHNLCHIRQARPPICVCHALLELDDLQTGRCRPAASLEQRAEAGTPSATSITFLSRSENRSPPRSRAPHGGLAHIRPLNPRKSNHTRKSAFGLREYISELTRRSTQWLSHLSDIEGYERQDQLRPTSCSKRLTAREPLTAWSCCQSTTRGRQR